MFNNKKISELIKDNYYLINIRSITESILCLSTLNEYYKNLDDKIEKIIEFVIKELKFKNGEY